MGGCLKEVKKKNSLRKICNYEIGQDYRKEEQLAVELTQEVSDKLGVLESWLEANTLICCPPTAENISEENVSYRLSDYLPPAKAPFQRIGIDLLGQFPKSNMGNKWIVVRNIYFACFTNTQALPNEGYFLLEVILKQGTPRKIISDRVFQSRVVFEIIKLCDTINTE
ncbi:hypothetical protein LAZ67_4003656 [Cordylochernes scorpioides]|uniref:Uncharacterized protein n=1 Tax=Cordylochernes scorpioides TaxID=51811 RepID=A0ABY6KDU8_9ARAC|nr:hypothetical protein LAZ67_4003656 [Cordylochernes scorpioides]